MRLLCPPLSGTLVPGKAEAEVTPEEKEREPPVSQPAASSDSETSNSDDEVGVEGGPLTGASESPDSLFSLTWDLPA